MDVSHPASAKPSRRFLTFHEFFLTCFKTGNFFNFKRQESDFLLRYQ